jgi:methionine-rich copper-binding protein CopC
MRKQIPQLYEGEFTIKRLFMILMSVVLLVTAIPVATVLADDLSTEEKYRFLVKKGIFTGFDDGSSRLHTPMTREQFAAVLFRLWELKKETAKPSYSDVLKTRWSFGEIQAVTKSGLMKGTGNGSFAPASNVTIEQLAVVLVRAYGVSGSSSASVFGKVSPWAKHDVGIALNKKWIPAQSDYRVNALRSLLVEAAFTIFIDMNPNENPEHKKLDIVSVIAVSNNVVQVDLRSAVSSVSIEQFELEQENGRAVSIMRVSLSQDGKRVIITTDWQNDGGVYRLKVDGSTWVYKVSLRDTTKPYVTSIVITADAKIELTFSEPVDKSSAEYKANYTINKNLVIRSVTLSPDNKKVTITTGQQTAATVYTLTVKNVKDLSGNIMDTRTDLHFGSVVDKTVPTVTQITLGENKVILVFSEALDNGTAEREENYVLDGGLGHSWKADYNDGSKTVTLTTAEQTNGKIYTMTLNGIKDKTGNAIASDTKISFAGKGKNSILPLTLQSINAVNENMLDLYFNRSLDNFDLSGLKIEIVTDNGSSVSISDWRYYFVIKQGDDRTIRIQFRKTDQPNPSLFKEGHVYEARITGISGLKTSNNENSKRFAGINETNRLPIVTNVVPVNTTAVTVHFSEAVKNVSPASFRLLDEAGNTLKIASDQLNDRNKIVTQVTLNLEAKLVAGKTYRLGGGEGITDGAGWNGLITQKDSKPYLVSFLGINQDNESPRFKSVTVKDRYTIEIEFTEPVTGAEQNVYALYNETDRTAVNITKDSHAGYHVSEDRQKVTIHLFAGAAGPLRTGKTYTLTYNKDVGRIADLQGERLDTSSGRGEVKFTGIDRDNAHPEISAVEGWSSVLFITLSEKVTGIQINSFELIAGGNRITPTSVSLQGNVALLHVTGLNAGTTASVKFSSQAADTVLDLNKQKPVVETVYFTVP